MNPTVLISLAEVVVEFSIALLLVFVVSLPGYIIFQRKYIEWTDNLLKCHKGEKPLNRFYKLFNAYWPLTALVTFGILITEIGWTTSVNLFDLAVFFCSSCIILFLVRAVATAPLLKNQTNPKDIIQHLVGFVWVGAIIGSVRLALLFVYNPGAYQDIVRPLYTIQTLTYEPINLIIWVGITVLLPLILVSTVLELIVFVYCRYAGVERNWTKDEGK